MCNAQRNLHIRIHYTRDAAVSASQCHGFCIGSVWGREAAVTRSSGEPQRRAKRGAVPSDAREL